MAVTLQLGLPIPIHISNLNLDSVDSGISRYILQGSERLVLWRYLKIVSMSGFWLKRDFLICFFSKELTASIFRLWGMILLGFSNDRNQIVLNCYSAGLKEFDLFFRVRNDPVKTNVASSVLKKKLIWNWKHSELGWSNFRSAKSFFQYWYFWFDIPFSFP